MELGEFRNAVGELSQLLTQAIVIPFRRKRARQTRPVRPEGPHAPSAPLGWLVVAGGGRLPDDLVVEMIHRAGGRRAKAAVVPAAHLDPVWAGERYVRYLTRFGMQDIDLVDLSTRERASNPAVTAPLEDAELILLGGGDGQLLLDCVAGTAAADALRRAHRRGAVVASVGGAAAASGDVAIAWRSSAGQPAGSAARATDVEVRPGLGLLPGCLVDRQGVQRGQVGRLFFAVAGAPVGEGRRAPLSGGVQESAAGGGLGAAAADEAAGDPAADGTGDPGAGGSRGQTSAAAHRPGGAVAGAFGHQEDVAAFTRGRPAALAVGRPAAPAGRRSGRQAAAAPRGTGPADAPPGGLSASERTSRPGAGAADGGPSPWAGAAAGERRADGLLGIGLDEETALLVEPGWQAEVWGAGVVMLIDGRTASPSRSAWAGAAPALTGMTVHVLPQGWRLDLRARHAYPPDAVRAREGR